MNDKWQNETIITGGGQWRKESDGTYTKSMNIHYRNGRVDTHLMETGVTEKEYFKRKLEGNI